MTFAKMEPICQTEYTTGWIERGQFVQPYCMAAHHQRKIEFRGWKDVEMKFPLIEDITMEIAKRYGMIQPGESSTKAVRAVFLLIERIIRAIIYYPLSLGPFKELKR